MSHSFDTHESSVRRVISAGGVVYQRMDGRVQVVLCGRQEPYRWALPKGRPNDGENLINTALREVQEETGLEVRIESAIGSISYRFFEQTGSYYKTVYYHLMIPVGGRSGLHDDEFDCVQWFEIEVAINALTYRDEIQILRRAVAILNKETTEGKF